MFNACMDDQQLLRYSRHILLPDIEYQGQEKLLHSHILIVGAGGLGAPIAIYCAAAGVGKMTICDFDDVDLSNLQRQIIHDTQSVGVNKASSAKQFIQLLNPDVEVIAVTEKQTEASMKAAGILASWMGAQAFYRQAEFELLDTALPTRHSWRSLARAAGQRPMCRCLTADPFRSR